MISVTIASQPCKGGDEASRSVQRVRILAPRSPLLVSRVRGSRSRARTRARAASPPPRPELPDPPKAAACRRGVQAPVLWRRFTQRDGPSRSASGARAAQDAGTQRGFSARPGPPGRGKASALASPADEGGRASDPGAPGFQGHSGKGRRRAGRRRSGGSHEARLGRPVCKSLPSLLHEGSRPLLRARRPPRRRLTFRLPCGCLGVVRVTVSPEL